MFVRLVALFHAIATRTSRAHADFSPHSTPDPYLKLGENWDC
ncbi:MAG: hypothetical protein RL648_1793 [Verrucomicrobiota bacterium]